MAIVDQLNYLWVKFLCVSSSSCVDAWLYVRIPVELFAGKMHADYSEPGTLCVCVCPLKVTGI